MNAPLILVIAVLASAALAWVAVALWETVRSDGYGVRPAPRSHPDEPTPFDRAA